MVVLNSRKPNILLFGDIMLDYNIYGSIEKLANEAPIPVLHKSEEKNILGGCGNVALNLHSLGCNSITLFSMIGDDNYGKKIRELLDSSNIKHYFTLKGLTTVKNRFFCDKKLLFRYDIEKYSTLSSAEEDTVYEKFLEVIESTNVDSIVFSDYNKGFLTERLCQKIIVKANEKNIFTCVDPKNNYEKYINCSCIKPNRNEVKKLFGIDCVIENIDQVLYSIKNKIKSKYVVITLADKGISFLNSDKCYFYENNNSMDVIDVTGAGDIVNSIISYYFPSSTDKEYIIKMSSYVATRSVSHVGTYVVSPQDILCANRFLNDNKLIVVDDLKFIKNPIVFTNGCFDILHKGHLELFKYCKKQLPHDGIFIVGLNSDDSIQRLKGLSRPVNNLESRIHMLNSISIIDYIIVFNEDTPFTLLSVLKPDILVKGGDYTYDTIVGKEYCKDIKIFNTLLGYSTTNIIEKTLKLRDTNLNL